MLRFGKMRFNHEIFIIAQIAFVYPALRTAVSPDAIFGVLVVNVQVGVTTLGLTVIVTEQTAGVVPACPLTVIV